MVALSGPVACQTVTITSIDGCPLPHEIWFEPTGPSLGLGGQITNIPTCNGATGSYTTHVMLSFKRQSAPIFLAWPGSGTINLGYLWIDTPFYLSAPGETIPIPVGVKVTFYAQCFNIHALHMVLPNGQCTPFGSQQLGAAVKIVIGP